MYDSTTAAIPSFVTDYHYNFRNTPFNSTTYPIGTTITTTNNTNTIPFNTNVIPPVLFTHAYQEENRLVKSLRKLIVLALSKDEDYTKWLDDEIGGMLEALLLQDPI